MCFGEEPTDPSQLSYVSPLQEASLLKDPTPLVLILALLTGCPSNSAKDDNGENVATVGTTSEPLDPTLEAKKDRARRQERRAAASAERVKELKARLKSEPVETLLAKGLESANAGNHKDAAEAYTAVVVHYPAHEKAGWAAGQGMTAWKRLNEDTNALFLGEDAVRLIEKPVARARIERVLAERYLSAPHWGSRVAGEVVRGQHLSSQQVTLFRQDRRRAIELLEGARARMHIAYMAKEVPLGERVALQNDLVDAIARFTPYDSRWNHWWYAWAESEDDDRVAEEQRKTSRRYYWSWWDTLSQAKPRGIEVDGAGQPVFLARPDAYEDAEEVSQKIKFLLHEVRELDDTEDKAFAARALMHQANVFRARDGAERLQRLGTWWHLGKRPYQKEVEAKSVHELEEDEVLGLVATHVAVYRPPEDESFPALLRRVLKEHGSTASADHARHLLGQFFQSRKQYPRAIEAYKAHIDVGDKKSNWVSSSRNALTTLERPEAAFTEGGVQPIGRPATMKIRARNLDALSFKTRKVDLGKVFRDFKKAYNNRTTKGWSSRPIRPSELGWALFHNQNDAVKRYATKAGPSFEGKIDRDPSGRYKDTVVETPLKKAGLYVVDAYNGKDRIARGLILIEAHAVVQKASRKGALAWIVDAATGAPRGGAKLEVFEYWSDWKSNNVRWRSRAARLTANSDGLADVKANHEFLVAVQHKSTTSYFGYGYGWGGWSPPSGLSERVAFIQPDRPVYRPGEEVQLKVFVRRRQAGVYRPASDVKSVRVEVRDNKGEQLFTKTIKADRFGAVATKMELGAMAALGRYTVQVYADGGWTRGHQTFSVEEYKAPEFTVSVESAGQAKLGENVPVAIKGTYLFGSPVAGGKVRYRVYRSDYVHDYLVPHRWDWLYGLGYGRCYYAYTWFGWWRSVPPPAVWYPWWGPPPEPEKELVLEGEGVLDDEGVLKFDVDTARAAKEFAETDHRYSVTAEVTDLSRRLIKGTGSLLVTRAAYFANVEIEGGWTSYGDAVVVHVATQKADGKLFATQGELVIKRVTTAHDGGAVVVEKEVARLQLKTREEAPVRQTWRAPKSGQYVISFESKDKSGALVKAHAIAWVAGPDYHGRDSRPQSLELRVDKRSYAIGDTVKLLINTEREGSHVLLSRRAENGRVLDREVLKLKGRSTVLEIPVTEGDVPNFFIEASTVDGAELFTEVREVFVPPKSSELDIDITADKKRYGPGDEVTLKVKTRVDDKAVSASVALAVFDRAVLYIQPELVPEIRKHFWARRRNHYVQGHNNLALKFDFVGQLMKPDQQAGYALAAANEVSRDGRFNAEASLDAPADDTLVGDTGAAIGGLGTRGAGSGGGGRAQQAVGKSELARAPAPELEARESKSKRKDADVANKSGEKADEKNGTDSGGNVSASSVRRRFVDTAHFAPTVTTNAQGEATVKFKLPDNLTTWKVKAVGMDEGARAGESTIDILSSKDLLVRLEAPRFFRERDRVVISAIVNNRSKKTARGNLQLRLDDQLLKAEGNLKRAFSVGPGKDQRFDFWVKVTGEGRAKIRVDAVSGKQSDAKEMTFPVLVHGLVKTVSKVGSIENGKGAAELSMKFEVPKERRPALTTLEIRYSPTLAGGMLDAIPYLLEYPYGCTEQTLSRFLPAVLARKALQDSGGLKLEQLQRPTNLNPQELTKDGKTDAARNKRELLDRSPVFSSKEMNRMIAVGLRRLSQMQNGDGGWGWWGSDRSSLYTTAHVVDGLLEAQDADLRLPNGMLQRGLNSLQQLVNWRLKRPHGKDWVSNDDAFAAYVLARGKRPNKEMNAQLFDKREQLAAYGKLLSALALHASKDKREKFAILVQNAEQRLKVDDENETAWLETAAEGWWYWYQNDIETNAVYLRVLDTIDGVGRVKRSDRVVKWLLNNRKNGTYWRSTRDTARVIASFAHHMKRAGERKVDMDVEVLLDDKVVRTVHIDRSNMLTFDGAITIEGPEVTGGEHTLTFRKKGQGALYANAYLSYFSTEEDVKGSGLEVRVQREVFKLVRDDRVKNITGDRGQKVASKQVAYRKVKLESGDVLKSGDEVLVELTLESKNDYTFLAFEDPKPAGFEPVALRSGTAYGELVTNMELRDTRVVFFVRELPRGKRKLSYRLRAEIPGEFHTMPTFGYGMYAPELRATSDEIRLGVTD